MQQHRVTAEGITAAAGMAVINLELQTRARIARIGHSVGCGRPEVAIGSEFVDMPRHDGQQNLREELRTLARRARERRRAAGKADSHREAVTIANRDYHGGDIQAQRVSDWLSDDDDRFRVPRDSDKVWALVQVWGAWVAERQDRTRWNNLVAAAQPRPSRPPAASTTSAADAGHAVAPTTAGAGMGPATQIAEEFAALAIDGQVVQAATIPQVVFGGVSQWSTLPPPRQLPPAIQGFVGRADQLALLEALLSSKQSSGDGDAASVAVLHGVGGVGKTALAVRWAHRVQHLFPDGTLFANMRGHGPSEPIEPGWVLAGFLRALGVPDERMPRDIDEQSALYRSLLAGRRVLILLDNAASAGQILSLLPGMSGSFVLVTSRARLTELVIDSAASLVGLDRLTSVEAQDLVRGIVGTDRHLAEPEAVLNLIRVCDGLPLALRVAAFRIAGHSGVAEVVEGVTRDQGRSNLGDSSPVERSGDRTMSAHEATTVPFRRPRVKFDHRPVRIGDDLVRIGGIVPGIAADIRDPDGWVWALLDMLDGSRTVDQVVVQMIDEFPHYTEDDVQRAIADLVGAGYIEDADDCQPHGLTYRERERYSRSRAWFHWLDRTPRLSSWDAQLRLRQARVVVVGVGGVGCAAALALVTSGVGHLHCVEPDNVDLSNLNRQILYTEGDLGRPKVDVAVERLRQHNSDITITGESTEVNGPDSLRELVAEFDVLLLCADRPVEIRSWANQACYTTDTAWVHAGYHGPQAVVGLYRPRTGPCYDCAHTAERVRRTQQPHRDWTPTTTTASVHAANAVSASISGNLAAHAVMSLLTGAPALRLNCQFGLNLAVLGQSFTIGPEHPHPDCPTCGKGAQFLPTETETSPTI